MHIGIATRTSPPDRPQRGVIAPLVPLATDRSHALLAPHRAKMRTSLLTHGAAATAGFISTVTARVKQTFDLGA
ncbi:MAG TPA: hypothetical protein PLB81_09355 [Deltaproteobacteria bacterium]|nr:hypothetical protein [Deltaproteobacteria bacterium]